MKYYTIITCIGQILWNLMVWEVFLGKMYLKIPTTFKTEVKCSVTILSSSGCNDVKMYSKSNKAISLITRFF